MKNIHASAISPIHPARLAEQIRAHATDELHRLHAIMRHPRSLARPLPSWRPPRIRLPLRPYPELTATLTRYRVGPRTRALVSGGDDLRIPAYLISLRFSRADGGTVRPQLSEAWVRGMVGEHRADTVHVLDEDHAPTYCWLVDSEFRPLRSPASLFEGVAEAA
ncbi:hypothetical protein L1O03_06960 [Corynebacterium uropygiale]|uniref:Uncharacterized protein n=1 Tax=Corynebacterium uropygiale TaxID=1775911 RepID=A0A9X1QR69_9CORY|nr:hypothetical protein [Corynebacterium uropygiale]MCF4006917.1 hypothetical protein [Corynebacterium uropygiale]